MNPEPQSTQRAQSVAFSLCPPWFFKPENNKKSPVFSLATFLHSGQKRHYETFISLINVMKAKEGLYYGKNIL